MKFLSLIKPVIVGALLTPYALAVAQGITIADIVVGKGRPSTLQPEDLPDGFRAAKIVNAGPTPDPMTAMLPFMMMGTPGETGGPNLDFFDLINESWTDGSVELIEGQRFLVTYQLDMSLMDFFRKTSRVNGGAPSLPPAKLKLRLVRVDGIQSIAPNPDLTKERMLEILGQGRGKTIFDQASEASDRTATLSNVKQIALGTIMYTADWDDIYPYAQGTKAVQYVTFPYLKNAEVWTTKNPNGGEFRFNLAVGGTNSSAIPNPAETVLFYESNEWPDGRRAVAFADGHAKIVSREEWARLSGGLAAKFPKTAKRPLPLNYGMNWKPGSPYPTGG